MTGANNTGQQKNTASGGAADDFAAEILKFHPLSVWRTFRWVLVAPLNIGDALNTRNWNGILSPVRYLSACLAILAGAIWFSGQTHDWSFPNNFIWCFYAFLVCPFIVAQYVILTARTQWPGV